VPGEERAHAGTACRGEHLLDLAEDRVAILKLARDADLHIVDHERKAARVADVLERGRHLEGIDVFHAVLFVIYDR
jgi:hypothetical protein